MKRQASDNAASTQELFSWRNDRVLWTIVGAMALLGLICNFAVLIGFGPDEPRHMNYVRLLLSEHVFPFLEAGQTEHAGAHTLHPPLYYLLLAPFLALFQALPGEIEWHLLRLVSLALCLGALPLWYQIALRAGEGDRHVARLAVAHIALLPMLGMIGGVINNDSASFFAVALFVWLLAVKFPDDVSLKSALWIGLCFGLGGLTKATVLLCDGAALLVYLWLQRDVSPLSRALFWQRLAIIGAGVLLISGPWYMRNVSVYGQFAGPIATGFSLVDMKMLPPGGPLVMMMHPNFPQLFGMVNWSVFYSLWSQKDWIPESFRDAVYYVLATYCAFALLGLALSAARRKKAATNENAAHMSTHAGRIARASSVAAFGINWLACITIALFQHWGWHEGGRYLLPSIGGLAILLALGWRGLLNPNAATDDLDAKTSSANDAGATRMRVLLLAWCVSMLALNAVAIGYLVFTLNVKYGPGA